jgi:hypothetical protein
VQEHSNLDKPTTYQSDLAKLPRALTPLVERPQWVVWRWTQQSNGRCQKPPYQALNPQRHASTKDPDTWCDYATALTAVQAGKADGISFVMTEADPLAAIDLDHCRHLDTGSIDAWAQNFLDVARRTYTEVTPSGTGCRIWGLTGSDTDPVNRKFTLEIDGKPIAAELFRRTSKVLTVTGYRLDSIRELSSRDRVFGWAVIWGERRKAAAAEAAQFNSHSFNNGGSGHDIDHIERIVREGAAAGANRSDTFHTVVGHYLGCGWNVEQIDELLRQFPEGIAGRYFAEGRLSREISGAPVSTLIGRCRCSMVGRHPRKLSKRRRRKYPSQYRLNRKHQRRIQTTTLRMISTNSRRNRGRIRSCRRSIHMGTRTRDRSRHG